LINRLATYPLVRVRARLMAEHERCAVLGFPNSQGAVQQVTVDYAELGMRDDAAAISMPAVNSCARSRAWSTSGCECKPRPLSLAERKCRLGIGGFARSPERLSLSCPAVLPGHTRDRARPASVDGGQPALARLRRAHRTQDTPAGDERNLLEFIVASADKFRQVLPYTMTPL
jgi:hypothetical protein